MENKKEVYCLRLTEKLRNEVQSGKEFSAKNLPSFIITLMQTVESFQGLSGSQKKDLVMSALQQYNNTIRNSQQLSLEFLSSIIDTVIDIDNGYVSINTIHGCVNLCFGCLGYKKVKRGRK